VGRANPGAVHDPELFRREELPKLAGARFTEIACAAGCPRAYTSNFGRGKWIPHASTWQGLALLAGVRNLSDL
jgi:hypothetical protein